ncbi:DUF317 domain-containing protein [Streptomyces sp. NBC_00347]|uniref:DUF317 domain-containing protein n=1 Tax=Streptomyces sp. NBC_00347 TaxID=2975721 RepID=UPI00225103C9|nr:DUF317 domain-containing protein [Streptomyces sp. NBC_00347]MCX5126818.1 DUF317 domain-containing protein [Streptomyces sp. NBC_00347]
MSRQWKGWGPGAELPEHHYLIEPRHLAGGGDIRHVTEYLRASGWADRTPRAGTPVVFDSPDQSVRIGYNVAATPPGWTVSGRATPEQAAWHVTLTAYVPVEIIAGFTDALTQPRPAHAPNVWAPLEEQNWATARGKHFTATSPDGDAWIQFHQNEPGKAHWWAGARTEHGRAWDAVFSQTTPMHLVQEFATALADPQPVMRPRGHVPATDRIRTTSVSVLPSHLAAWKQARVTAARSATWARNAWAARQPRKAAPRAHTSRSGAAAGRR